MREGKASLTAEFIALFRALETVRRPPERRVASARSAEPCGASISRNATPLPLSRCTARAQNGHQGWV